MNMFDLKQIIHKKESLEKLMAQSFTLHSVRIENDPIFVEEQTQSTPTISFVQYSSIDEFAFPVGWNENNFLQTLWSSDSVMKLLALWLKT